MHPDYLLPYLTASQLREWQDYNQIEPFGEFRSELRHGQMMALTMNINRDPKRQPDPFRAVDCMNFIEHEKPAEPKLTQEQINKVFCNMFGV